MSEYAIELNNISKSYKDGSGMNVVLDHITLKVKKGEFAAIVGPSGSGKSTLLAISGMLLSSDKGDIIIGVNKLLNKTHKEGTRIRRENIGFIFQNHQLLPYLTTEDQLKLVADMSTSKAKADKSKAVDDILRDLGIEDCRKKYPKQMSGGQKQRVAIARAFMNEPYIILADEPTASLDGIRGRQIAEMIRQQVKKKNTAAIMVTHDERILDLVDSIYYLENGKLIKKN
ncbi:ABC transporter ATP-binding protein [Clostridium sp. 19966]|uniref:ABC transporter ATP-binding protein n=1 Tax=Clostridium sp. 19966 TaxID=2768166 RepID=UPI0028DE49A5|nr:ABC transporter ATP-binding protein [Clostridium sp. 19966]MDT8717338.1 ABC transporter ATP-binding protein [Clostridium sp. 19966]